MLRWEDCVRRDLRKAGEEEDWKKKDKRLPDGSQVFEVGSSFRSLDLRKHDVKNAHSQAVCLSWVPVGGCYRVLVFYKVWVPVGGCYRVLVFYKLWVPVGGCYRVLLFYPTSTFVVSSQPLH